MVDRNRKILMTTEIITPKTTLNAPAQRSFLANKSILVPLALAAVYIIWGTTYLGIRIALVSFPPYILMGTRFLIAGGALFVFLRLRGAPMPTRRQWGSAAIVGLLLLGFGMGSTAMAEQTISSGLAATLVATSPLWTMVFGMFWKQFPTKLDWIGVALGLVGVAVLTFEGNLQANPSTVLLMLFATAAWSFGSVWMRHLDMPKGAMGNAAEMLCGGIVLMGFALLHGEQITTAPTTDAVLALAYLTTFGSLVTISAYMYLLNNVSPALATSYSLVNPAIALLLGVVLGGEILTGSALIALPLILGAIAFVVLGNNRKQLVPAAE